MSEALGTENSHKAAIGGRGIRAAARLAHFCQSDYSDAWPPTTQLCYHMPRRSPVIFWLLLAATLCVDAIILMWMASGRFSSSGYVVVAFHALVFAQLSLVCIWSAMSLTQIVWMLTIPIIATVVAAMVTVNITQIQAQFPSTNALTSYLGYYGLHVALLMASIWFLQRTNFWRRRNRSVRTWQYSLLQILIVMTIVAILSTLMRNNLFFGGGKWLNIAFACSFVALALASVVLWSLSWHWVFRLASVLGVAVLLGACGYTLLTVSMRAGSAGPEPLTILVAFYLTQACVLTVWLGSGFILPTTNSEISVSSQTD